MCHGCEILKGRIRDREALPHEFHLFVTQSTDDFSMPSMTLAALFSRNADVCRRGQQCVKQGGRNSPRVSRPLPSETRLEMSDGPITAGISAAGHFVSGSSTE